MRALSFTAAAALSLASWGCVHRLPPVQLSTLTPVAVAYAVDRTDALLPGELPPGVQAAVGDALRRRNLDVRDAASPSLQSVFSVKRGTAQRLQELATATPEPPLLLLVELEVTYFEEIEGHFRWTVYGKATVAKRDDLTKAVTSTFEVPVYLLFAHQLEADALSEAASGIAEKSAAAVDAFVSGRDDFPQAPRPTALRGSSHPDSIYFAMVDRFANGDPRNDADANPADPAAFHGGDLQGVLDHLDYLHGMGVRTVWLSPVFAMRTQPYYGHGAYHGYWVSDFGEIEPRFGDRRLLRRLSDELHRRGMRLILDVVLNHVSFDAPLTRTHPEWFHHQGSITDWNDPEQLVNRDVMGLPDLAQERPEVAAYLIDTSLRWIDEIHPDGFRLDAVKHVPLAFWRAFSSAVRSHAGPGFELLGEDLEGSPSKIAQVQRAGGFTSMFDFPLRDALVDVFCKDQPVGRVAATLTDDRVYPDPASLVTLVDNHDLPRILTSCAGDPARASEAIALQMDMRGTPSIIWGTEAGLQGTREPENRGDMRFGVATPQRTAVVEGLAARFAHPVLATGTDRLIALDAEVMVDARLSPAETAIVAVNRSRTDRVVALPSWLGLSAIAVAQRSIATRFVGPAHPPPEGLRPVVVDVANAPAHAGDAVFIAGLGPELGDWDPSRALGPLALEDGRWTGRARLPSGGAFEMKLIVRHSDGQVEWESRPDRFVFVPDGREPLRVDARWGEAD